jgi:hypothetical protein
MVQSYKFFELTSYGEPDFAEYLQRMCRPDGVIMDIGGSQCTVTATGTPDMNVHVQDGEIFIRGFWYKNTAPIDIAINPNAGPGLRVDSIVARLDTTANTVSIAKLEGVPGGVAPALTQTLPIWEIRLANVLISAGAPNIPAPVIGDVRQFSRWPTVDVDQTTINSVQSALNTEIANRQAGDTTNTNNRIAGDNTNTSNRIAGDNANAAQRTTDINAAFPTTYGVRAWAYINSDGAVYSTRGIASCSRIALGTYTVTLNGFTVTNMVVHVSLNYYDDPITTGFIALVQQTSNAQFQVRIMGNGPDAIPAMMDHQFMVEVSGT